MKAAPLLMKQEEGKTCPHPPFCLLPFYFCLFLLPRSRESAYTSFKVAAVGGGTHKQVANEAFRKDSFLAALQGRVPFHVRPPRSLKDEQQEMLEMRPRKLPHGACVRALQEPSGRGRVS